MEKREIREHMRSLRKQMTKKERKEKDVRIREALYRLESFQKASCFFPFVSYGSEVDTIAIIEELFEKKEKRVAVPRVEGKEMEFYEISSMQDLEKGCMGILEPVTEKRVVPEEGILLMPGLAFDLSGNRIGYGGGYYDRYLKKYPCSMVQKVAVAYDFQVLDRIRTEEYDRKADLILTEKREILCFHNLFINETQVVHN